MAMLTSSALIGCQADSPASDSCLTFGPIYDRPPAPGADLADDPGNQVDTQGTHDQVLAHNSAWVCLCEHDC